jgi:hypothetical protein
MSALLVFFWWRGILGCSGLRGIETYINPPSPSKNNEMQGVSRPRNNNETNKTHNNLTQSPLPSKNNQMQPVSRPRNTTTKRNPTHTIADVLIRRKL